MDLSLRPTPMGVPSIDLRGVRSDVLIQVVTINQVYRMWVADRSSDGFLIVIHNARHSRLREPQVGVFIGAELEPERVFPNCLVEGAILHLDVWIASQAKLKRLSTARVVPRGIVLVEHTDRDRFQQALEQYQRRLMIGDPDDDDGFPHTVIDGS